ncbi:hypothetical protein ACFQT0_04200 [Hymenobacter humi]|uniref:Uncharacterized protein n=1 Tax=Hymenobacter humi TaxID=1411620 RepID=A0ABW2U325_9BACT
METAPSALICTVGSRMDVMAGTPTRLVLHAVGQLTGSSGRPAASSGPSTRNQRL